MSYAPEEWAKEWLLRRRAEGETGLTVERRGNSHYVRWATTVWDPVRKKRKKISEYRGKLTEDGVLHPPEPKGGGVAAAVRDDGLPRLIAKAAEGLVTPLKSYFPDLYRELLAVSFYKCAAAKTGLGKANAAWNDMLDAFGLRPRIHPASLADTLRAAGRAKGAQNAFFDDLRKGMGGTAGISVRLFSRDDAFVVRGRQDASGLELAYVCFMEPECTSIAGIIEKADFPEGTVAILGDHLSAGAVADLSETGIDFSIEADRESPAFDGIAPDAGSFLWDGGAVTYGRGEIDGRHVYVFDDLSRKNAEIVDGLRNGTGQCRHPGRTVVVSTVKTSPGTVYSWHMGRDAAERYFLSAGAILDSDGFPWDGDCLEGNDFVALLSMMMMLRIEDWISEAGMEGEMTAGDVLDAYSSAKPVRKAVHGTGEGVFDPGCGLGLGPFLGGKRKKARRR